MQPLLFLLAAVLLPFIAGCGVTRDGDPTATATAGNVTITMAADRFHQLQEVPFLLSNEMEETAFYLGGCRRPELQRLVEGEVRAVPEKVTEFGPAVRRLEPDLSLRCEWDKAIWNGRRNQLAPPGIYRLVLHYWLDEEAARSGEAGQQAVGDWFTFVDPALWHDDDAPGRLPPTPPSPASTVADGVTIETGGDEYAMRQDIPFTITNHLTVPITWRVKGCAAVAWVGQEEASYVVRDITEEVAPELTLAPGETLSCGWDQMAYYAIGRRGAGRFSSYNWNWQVPPGWYRFEIHYRPQDGEERVAASPLVAIARGEEERPLPAEATPGVTVQPAKGHFLPGEPVTYTIRNDSTRAATFDVGGCQAPAVGRIVGERLVGIAAGPELEPSPAPQTLAPGAAQTCVWDQQAWQNVARSGRERWKSEPQERAPVPPGRYQLRVPYELAPDTAGGSPTRRTARSQLFIIAPPEGLPPRPAPAPEVIVDVSQSEYKWDEPVVFTVTNVMTGTARYKSGGCDFPRIVRYEAGERVPIYTENTATQSGSNDLGPGESFTCTWEKMAWQHPTEEGAERYRGEGELLPAPNGYYQIVFVYRHPGDPNRRYRAYSPRFRIRQAWSD